MNYGKHSGNYPTKHDTFGEKDAMRFPLVQPNKTLLVEDAERQPNITLIGDFCFSVTEQEALCGPVIRLYHVARTNMREPRFLLWRAQDGDVLSPSAHSTAIAFHVKGVHAGQLWTSVISVQLTDADNTIILGTFVQILVTGEHGHKKSSESENTMRMRKKLTFIGV